HPRQSPPSHPPPPKPGLGRPPQHRHQPAPHLLPRLVLPRPHVPLRRHRQTQRPSARNHPTRHHPLSKRRPPHHTRPLSAISLHERFVASSERLSDSSPHKL